jgi:hypothetical protein
MHTHTHTHTHTSCMLFRDTQGRSQKKKKRISKHHYVHKYIDTHAHVYIDTHTHIDTHIHTHTTHHIHKNKYTYTYICTHKLTHTHTHTHNHWFSSVPSVCAHEEEGTTANNNNSNTDAHGCATEHNLPLRKRVFRSLSVSVVVGVASLSLSSRTSGFSQISIACRSASPCGVHTASHDSFVLLALAALESAPEAHRNKAPS